MFLHLYHNDRVVLTLEGSHALWREVLFCLEFCLLFFPISLHSIRLPSPGPTDLHYCTHSTTIAIERNSRLPKVKFPFIFFTGKLINNKPLKLLYLQCCDSSWKWLVWFMTEVFFPLQINWIWKIILEAKPWKKKVCGDCCTLFLLWLPKKLIWNKAKKKIETDNKADRQKKLYRLNSVINMHFVWKLEILHVFKTNRI